MFQIISNVAKFAQISIKIISFLTLPYYLFWNNFSNIEIFLLHNVIRLFPFLWLMFYIYQIIDLSFSSEILCKRKVKGINELGTMESKTIQHNKRKQKYNFTFILPFVYFWRLFGYLHFCHVYDFYQFFSLNPTHIFGDKLKLCA